MKEEERVCSFPCDSSKVEAKLKEEKKNLKMENSGFAGSDQIVQYLSRVEIPKRDIEIQKREEIIFAQHDRILQLEDDLQRYVSSDY
jgi:hypothetical protein